MYFLFTQINESCCYHFVTAGRGFLTSEKTSIWNILFEK